MLRSLLILGLPALLAAQSQMIQPPDGQRAQEVRSLTIQPNGVLKVRHTVGNLKVIAWDRQDVELRAAFTPGGDGQQMKVKVDGGGNYLEVQSSQPKSRRGWRFWRTQNPTCTLELRVPRNIAAELSTDVGNINLDGVKGRVNLSSDVGRIEATNLDGQGQGISARTDVGTIQMDLRGVKGNLRARTDVGSISMDNPGIQCSSQGRGKVDATLQGGGQLIDLRTDVGSIRIR